MQLTKIQKQIENNPWKTAITIRKNNQTILKLQTLIWFLNQLH